MCGIVGFVGGPWSAGGPMPALLGRMVRCIGHRGPDSDGQWLDDEHRVALGHLRLAIVDLTPAGAQPMDSASGHYVIVYNGEIYNHADIRAELEATGNRFDWRGHSDTEVLLAAIETWGIEAALKRTIGMFAFALWDRREKTLTLARDRVGEKPLYYGWQGEGADAAFLFGSELKALRHHPSFRGEMNREALTLYMRHNYIPGPYSIYRGLQKLVPGSYLTLRQGEREPIIRRYWSAAEAAEAGVANPLGGSAEELTDQLEALLKSAVGKQMMADVPLGAFLSGGIDSSAIVALMQAQSSRPVKTFSIGFHEEAYNEAEHARAVAKHLGTDHTDLYVTPEQAMAVIPRLPKIYDEPFADSSQIPTFLVSQLARKHVTVSLSGDAGDELFSGYNRYNITDRSWSYISAVPRPLRGVLASGITSVAPGSWNKLARPLRPLSRKFGAGIGEKLHKGAAVLSSRSVADVYRGVVSHWLNPASIVVGGVEPATQLTGDMPRLEGLNDIERMMALDLLTYLPDDILVKVDRAAMAVSLESRVPFLDHRVVEFAWRVPMEYKLRQGQTKWILRQVLYRHVPKALIERPKMGFGVPIDSWLRGPLKDWAEALLDESRLRQEGYLNPEPIRKLWAAHQEGRVSMPYHLWDVLMFQSWLEAQGQAPASGFSSAPELNAAA